MARFGINTEKAFGVSMAAARPLARKYRRQHDLAAGLWASGIHEARILAALIDDPKLVTRKQMDAWAAEFNSWDLCDQACMKLFAKTPYVAEKVAKWAKDEREFVRRAAFATIAGYAVSAKKAADEEFLPFLALIEAHATDPRNFVQEGGQLGAPADRQALAGAPRPCPRARRKACSIRRQDRALDRQGCSEGAFRPEADRAAHARGRRLVLEGQAGEASSPASSLWLVPDGAKIVPDRRRFPARVRKLRVPDRDPDTARLRVRNHCTCWSVVLPSQVRRYDGSPIWSLAE